MRLLCVVLSMLVLLGCQAPSDGPQSAIASTSPTVTGSASPTSVANVSPTDIASPTDIVTAPVAGVDSQAPVATGLISVWGEVPKQCA